MKSIKVKSEAENLYKVINYVKQETQTEDYNLELIIEEIFVNIINYAESDYIIINIEHDTVKNIITLEFIDNGIEFNPFNQDEPELPNSIEEAKIGGLGIHFVKNLSDSMKYYYDGKNHLKITKSVKI